MNRTSKLLALVLALLLLVGCTLPDKTVSCEDLTISLPGHFVDLSDQDVAQSMTFLYGFGTVAVMGLREARSELEANYPNITLEQYAKSIIAVSRLDCVLTQRDGLYTFTYTAAADSLSFTYLSAVYEGTDAFWVVQAYCLTEEFPKNEASLWQYLLSVKVS